MINSGFDSSQRGFASSLPKPCDAWTKLGFRLAQEVSWGSEKYFGSVAVGAEALFPGYKAFVIPDLIRDPGRMQHCHSA